MTPAQKTLHRAWKATPCPKCAGGYTVHITPVPRTLTMPPNITYGVQTVQRCRSCSGRGHASIHEFANTLNRNRRLIGRYISGKLKISAPVLALCEEILKQQQSGEEHAAEATTEA